MFKILFFIITFSTQACVVLLYHHFDNKTPPSTSISPELFSQHLQYIKTNNFKVLSAADLIKKIKNKQKLPNKCVTLTTDDAYISIYTNALPLLKKYQFPMSVFVATDNIGKKYKNFMSYEQMEKSKPLLSFYNHSTGHQHFYKLNKQQIKTNILQAQKRLIKELSVTEKIFTYPYGEYNVDAYNIIKELNFSAFGQHSGAINLNSDINLLPRFPMTDTYGKMSSFKIKINTLAPDIISQKPLSPIVKKNPPSLKIKFKQKINLTCFVSGKNIATIKWINNTATVIAKNPLPQGRSKYNCTAPSKYKGRFYWFSKQWIVI